MIAAYEAISAFRASLWAANPRRTRAQFEEWQAKALRRWLVNDVPRVGAFADAPQDLGALPYMDKAGLMANFASYNRPQLSADEVRTAMSDDCRIGSFTVGASTGTSGNRGLFVIAERERFRWLGSILAKTIPDLLWQRRRIAIVLPQSTPLYDAARKGNRLDLQFFSLTDGIDTVTQSLVPFDPHVIVAPPKVLRYLAEEKTKLAPITVFSAAETLDLVDRCAIETHFGSPLEQIYMATEGLLGVTCRAGNMHLAEDSIHFEYEPVGDGLVSPIISCFRRQTQILARYRMNDLLRLSDAPCSCGSVLQAVTEVVGRKDDCFELVGDNGTVLITPDVLRNAVLDAHTAIDDFRLIQTAAARVELHMSKTLPDIARTAAIANLHGVFQARGVSPGLECITSNLSLDTSRKLRRVENRWRKVQGA